MKQVIKYRNEQMFQESYMRSGNKEQENQDLDNQQLTLIVGLKL